MAAPVITRDADTDDDGTGNTGTVHNNTWKTAIYNRIDAVIAALYAGVPTAPGISTVTTTGNITALALPAGSGDLVIYLNNATLSTIQGIAAGADGQRLTLLSKGAGQVDLAHQNGGASAANRLINCATSGNTSLAPGVGTAVYVYDATATRWRLVSHEQGAWITPAYAGGNFAANGSMTWTVDAGDVTTCAYYLKGRTLTITWELATTTVGGTPNTQLKIGNGAWGGLTAAKAIVGQMVYLDNGASAVTGEVSVGAAATELLLTKFSGNWSAATNTTYSFGQVLIEVT